MRDEKQELDDRVARYFWSVGNDVRLDVRYDGLSGLRHRLDVVAETSGATQHERLAIRCAVGGVPVEREVVMSLAFAVTDCELTRGIFVSDGSVTPAALQAAKQVGIEIWSVNHLGDRENASGFDDPGVSLVPRIDRDSAIRLMQRHRLKGLGWRTEKLESTHTALLPVFELELALIQSEQPGKKWNIYEALGGGLVHSADSPLQFVARSEPFGSRLLALVHDARIIHTIDQRTGRLAISWRETQARRHEAALEELGIPEGVTEVSVEGSRFAWWPVYIGVLATGDERRAAVVDAVEGEVNAPASAAVTRNLKSWLNLIA